MRFSEKSQLTCIREYLTRANKFNGRKKKLGAGQGLQKRALTIYNKRVYLPSQEELYIFLLFLRRASQLKCAASDSMCHEKA
jgi:hypothetical protein